MKFKQKNKSLYTKIMALRFLTTLNENFPEIIKDMRECEHGVDKHTLNSYHMEGSVLAHTFMVIHEAIKAGVDDTVLYAAILHDTGKPHCRSHETSKDGKRQLTFFKKHESYSFWMACDVLQHDSFKQFTSTYECSTILNLVSCHTSLFDRNRGKTPPCDKYRDSEFLNQLVSLTDCDSRGRINKGELVTDEVVQQCIAYNQAIHDEKDFDECLLLAEKFAESTAEIREDQAFSIGDSGVFNNVKNRGEDQQSIYMMVGLPGGGKSTLAADFDCTVIERDFFVNKCEGKNYNEKWIASITGKDTILPQMLNIVRDTLDDNKSCLIDMTNMSKKSRRKWVNHNSVRKNSVWKVAIIICTGVETSCERAAQRFDKQFDNKNLPRIFAENFSFPLYDEVDEVRMIFA